MEFQVHYKRNDGVEVSITVEADGILDAAKKAFDEVPLESFKQLTSIEPSDEE